MRNLHGKYPALNKFFPLFILGLSFLWLGSSSWGGDEIPPPPAIAPTPEPRPSPTPSFPGSEKEVTFVNPDAGVTLAGTLTLPEGKGPFPAALLIAGSGPNLRGPFFLLVAQALARKGVASLCYDKRGSGGSTGDFKTATCQDFEKDALAGIKYLRQLSEINPRKVGMIGHSEGGLIAPMAAAESKDVSFIVVMGAPGLGGAKGRDLYIAHKAAAMGAEPKTIEVLVRMTRDAEEVIRSNQDNLLTGKKLDEILKDGFSGLGEEEKRKGLFVFGGETVEAVKAKALSPWYRSRIGIDPQENFRKVRCPVLAMNGEKDAYAAWPENLDAIGDALKEGHNPDYTLKAFPGLNHALQQCKTGSPTEAVPHPETLAPEAMRLLVDWVVKHMH